MLPGISSAIAASKLLPFGYRNTYEDLTDLTTYSFTGCDFGEAATNRLVVVAITATVASGRTISSMTIGGVSATQAADSGSGTNIGAIWYAVVPTGATGTVEIVWSGTCTANLIHVFSGYPASSTPVDGLGAFSAGASTRVLTDLAKTSGGFSVFATRIAVDQTVVLTQNGAETITEHMDALKLGGGVRVGAMSHVNTATTTTDDYTATWAGSDVVNLVGATWA